MGISVRVSLYDNNQLLVIPETDIQGEILRKESVTGELFLDDGRMSSKKQRDKIHATIRDIAEWCGHDREYLRRYFTENFCEDNEIDYFSLSPRKENIVDMTTARHFITFLIEFCFAWNVPSFDTMRNRAEEIGKYLYLCLLYRKCAVCNSRADIHHEDHVGMGRNRKKIIHEGMQAIALCRKHHDEVHNMGKAFYDLYHLYTIALDKYLCQALKLKYERGEENNEFFERDKHFLQLDDFQPNAVCMLADGVTPLYAF